MTVNTSSWHDPRYHEAARYVQEGAWNAALEALHELQREYPDQEEIRTLIEETQIKVELDQKPIAGLSPLAVAILHRRRLTVIGVGLLILLVLLGGWASYRRWVEPARQLRRQQIALVEALNQAQRLMAESAYAEAGIAFETALQIDPQNTEAQAGLQEAQWQSEMADQYREAVNRMERGETIEALARFQELRDQAPDYKDVAERIDQILQIHRVQEIFAEAENAYLKGDWPAAILLYNVIRQQSITYRSATVEQHLFDSYMQLASQQINTSGLSAAQIDQTAETYRSALSIRPRDGLAQANLTLLHQYQQARGAMAAGNYTQSTPLLSALYANDPDLLGGDVQRSLFDSRLAYGDQLQAEGNLHGALEQYTAAAGMPVDGAMEARLRALKVELALAPTPTPTPTLSPTPTPDLMVEIQKLVTPTPAPLDQFQGWIAFRSDRPGSRTGLWVMRSDGSDQQPVADPTNLYAHLQQQAMWSPDNLHRIWVESDGGNASVAIYMWRYDVPYEWKEARVEVLNNSAINYYPVFSPDGQSIAFTSQHPTGPPVGEWGNWEDEIFVLHLAEVNPYGYVTPHRLTQNDWEWDKHPTFSPDGQRIAFWSNRITGRAQIWAMNVDGADQRNLSNNEWNDWDPVWVVPRREVPAVEKNSDDEIRALFDPALYEAGDSVYSGD